MTKGLCITGQLQVFSIFENNITELLSTPFISLTATQTRVTPHLRAPLAPEPGLRGCELHGEDGPGLQPRHLRRVPHHLGVQHGQVVRGGREVGALQRGVVVTPVIRIQPLNQC